MKGKVGEYDDLNVSIWRSALLEPATLTLARHKNCSFSAPLARWGGVYS